MNRVAARTLASFTALFAACQRSQPAPQIAPPPTPIPAVIAAPGAKPGMTNAMPRCMPPVTFTFADTSNAKIGSVGFCDTGTPAKVLGQPGRIDFSAKTFGGFVAQDRVALAMFLPQERVAAAADVCVYKLRMAQVVDDVRIRNIQELAPPVALLREIPLSEAAATPIVEARRDIHRILHGEDDRLLVVIGPCSIHDVAAAEEYALKLREELRRHERELLILMRVCFEKPRTTVGLKGLINDPKLDGSFEINEGLRIARRLLADLNALEVPCATEFLDVITPQYTADLISWGAIGARTTESQVHRELASGFSCPVGFKNGTDGEVGIAVDAIRAAQSPHHFLSVTKEGRSAIVSTAGNEDCHVILRGDRQPNYAASFVDAACARLAKADLAQRLMIDRSHANSGKQFERQLVVAEDIGAQIASGESRIVGVMAESHLVAGRQELVRGTPLVHCQSITDACLCFRDSVALLDGLARSVRARRAR